MHHAVTCSLCGHGTVKGQTRVRRCLVFNFCKFCLIHRPEKCEEWMETASQLPKK